jgi:hypothetical protein
MYDRDFRGSERFLFFGICVWDILYEQTPLHVQRREGASLVLYLFVSEVSVELCNEIVNVGAVNDASFFEAFHTGSGAAEAVHTDLEEVDCRCGVKIKNIANDAFSSDFHCDTKPFYHNLKERFVRPVRLRKNIT